MDFDEYFDSEKIGSFLWIKPKGSTGEKVLKKMEGFRKIAGSIIVEEDLLPAVKKALSEHYPVP